jgi:hypothetical protein
MTTLNENDQNKALLSITNKLYESIVDKTTEIDFGDIPKTRGDILKLEGYGNIIKTIALLRELLGEYKQPTTSIDIVETAVNNIAERVKLFELAFKTNSDLPIMIYNTMVLSVISSLALLISSSIEYIKEPGIESFELAIDAVALNKAKDTVLFSNLSKFNNSCANGTFDKAMNHIIKADSEQMVGFMAGFTLMNGVIIAGLALGTIPMLRELIYFFYYSRVRVSDYLNAQSDLLTMNAYRVEHSSTMDPAKSKVVAQKQYKIADMFKKSANKIEVTMTKADRDSIKDLSKVDKKMKADDIFEDEAPDSASALF